MRYKATSIDHYEWRMRVNVQNADVQNVMWIYLNLTKTHAIDMRDRSWSQSFNKN